MAFGVIFDFLPRYKIKIKRVYNYLKKVNKTILIIKILTRSQPTVGLKEDEKKSFPSWFLVISFRFFFCVMETNYPSLFHLSSWLTYVNVRLLVSCK